MAGRGRLIFTVMAQIFPLDTTATAANDNAGETRSGFNPYFREPVKFADGTNSRVEGTPLFLPCQVIGQRGPYSRRQPQAGGHSDSTTIELGFHFRDIEAAGLVDADGKPGIHHEARLGALFERNMITLIRTYTEPLFASEEEDRGIGFAGRRNLLHVMFQTRDKSTVTGVS